MILSAALERALNEERAPACGTDRSGEIVFLNRAWDERVEPAASPHARRSWLLGRSWFDAIGPDSRPFYRDLFHSALALRASAGTALLHLSECNTPSLIRRSLTWLAPLHERGVAIGVVMVHELENLGTPEALYGVGAEPAAAFRDRRGVVTQCSCCRRLQQPVGGQWHFVPGALAQVVPGVSQALCETCRETYRVAPVTVPNRWTA